MVRWISATIVLVSATAIWVSETIMLVSIVSSV
jgi:hypothetical protein